MFLKISELQVFMNNAKWFYNTKEEGHLKESAFAEYDQIMKKVEELHKVLQHVPSVAKNFQD